MRPMELCVLLALIEVAVGMAELKQEISLMISLRMKVAEFVDGFH